MTAIRIGDTARFFFEPRDCHLFDAQGDAFRRQDVALDPPREIG
jgi:hypothetical protein